MASPVTVITLVFDEPQVTEANCWVLLSLNVPVATNCCAVPRGRVVLPGLNEIATRFGGVNIAGSYNSALAKSEVEPTPPARSTMPLFSSVAV